METRQLLDGGQVRLVQIPIRVRVRVRKQDGRDLEPPVRWTWAVEILVWRADRPGQSRVVGWSDHNTRQQARAEVRRLARQLRQDPGPVLQYLGSAGVVLDVPA
jgi:hypothetical protein